MYANILTIHVTAKHKTAPHNAGTANAAKVHFLLPVSFLTVSSVVEHGQCIRVKIIVFTAVSHVQPLSESRCLTAVRSVTAVMLPVAIYAITIMGITVSFAGNPSINAIKITPSSPIKRAGASSAVQQMLSRDAPPILTFAKIHIISPAGAATAAALPSTKSVLSKTELTIIRPIAGRLYGGSSRVKEEG